MTAKTTQHDIDESRQAIRHATAGAVESIFAVAEELNPETAIQRAFTPARIGIVVGGLAAVVATAIVVRRLFR